MIDDMKPDVQEDTPSANPHPPITENPNSEVLDPEVANPVGIDPESTAPGSIGLRDCLMIRSSEAQ